MPLLYDVYFRLMEKLCLGSACSITEKCKLISGNIYCVSSKKGCQLPVYFPVLKMNLTVLNLIRVLSWKRICQRYEWTLMAWLMLCVALWDKPVITVSLYDPLVCQFCSIRTRNTIEVSLCVWKALSRVYSTPRCRCWEEDVFACLRGLTLSVLPPKKKKCSCSI